MVMVLETVASKKHDATSKVRSGQIGVGYGWDGVGVWMGWDMDGVWYGWGMKGVGYRWGGVWMGYRWGGVWTEGDLEAQSVSVRLASAHEETGSSVASPYPLWNVVRRCSQRASSSGDNTSVKSGASSARLGSPSGLSSAMKRSATSVSSSHVLSAVAVSPVPLLTLLLSHSSL